MRFVLGIAHWYASLVGGAGLRDETIEHLEGQALAGFQLDLGHDPSQNDAGER